MLAVAGVIPVKIKYGDAELSMLAAQTRQEVDSKASNMDVRELERLADKANKSGQKALERGTNSDPVARVTALSNSERVQQHLAFEEATTDLVVSIAKDLGLVIRGRSGLERSMVAADIVLERDSGPPFFVGIKLDYSDAARHQVLTMLREGNVLLLVSKLPSGVAGNIGRLQVRGDEPLCIVSTPEPKLVTCAINYRIRSTGAPTSPPGDVLVIAQ